MKRSMLTTLTIVGIFFSGSQVAKATHYHDAVQIVESFYPKYMHRSPDRGGMKYWRGELRKGVSLMNIEVRMLGSDEYYRIHGSCAESFVRGLLTEVTGQPACPKQVAYFMTRLAQCGCRETVAREVLFQVRSAPPVFGPAPSSVGSSPFVTNQEPPLFQQVPTIQQGPQLIPQSYRPPVNQFVPARPRVIYPAGPRQNSGFNIRFNFAS